jgi:hypothetical protein
MCSPFASLTSRFSYKSILQKGPTMGVGFLAPLVAAWPFRGSFDSQIRCRTGTVSRPCDDCQDVLCRQPLADIVKLRRPQVGIDCDLLAGASDQSVGWERRIVPHTHSIVRAGYRRSKMYCKQSTLVPNLEMSGAKSGRLLFGLRPVRLTPA